MIASHVSHAVHVTRHTASQVCCLCTPDRFMTSRWRYHQPIALNPLGNHNFIIVTLRYSLLQLPRNPLLLRRKYGSLPSYVLKSESPAAVSVAASAASAAAAAAKIILMNQITSDFHNTFGIHLGITFAHHTQPAHARVTRDSSADINGLCMSNTSYFKQLPRINFTGDARAARLFHLNILLPFSRVYTLLVALCMRCAF